MNHNQVQELASAYALGALESRERDAVFEHIQTCAICSLLVQDHVGVGAALSRAFPVMAPPDELRSRVLESIRGQPAPTRSQARPGLVFSGQGLLARWPVVAWATAAVVGVFLLSAVVALLAISQANLTDIRVDNQRLAGKLDEQRGFLGALQKESTELRRENQGLAGKLDEQRTLLATSQKQLTDLHKENQRLATTLNEQRAFTYLEALPGLNRFVLKNTPAAPGARGLLVANKDKVWGVALLINMKPLEPGMGYQIWLEKDGKTTSAGVVSEVDKETGYGQLYVVAFPQPLDKFSSVFVTLEPVAGSVAPTGQPLLTAPF